MNTFNPDDFINDDGSIITPNQINQLNNIYLKKTEFDTSTAITTFNNNLTFNEDINLTKNMNVNNKSISNIEISHLDGINTNIKDKLDF